MLEDVRVERGIGDCSACKHEELLRGNESFGRDVCKLCCEMRAVSDVGISAIGEVQSSVVELLRFRLP